MSDFEDIFEKVPEDVKRLRNIFLSSRWYPFLLIHKSFGVLVVRPIHYQAWMPSPNNPDKLTFQRKNLNYQVTHPALILREQCYYLSYWLQGRESEWLNKKISFNNLPPVRCLFFLVDIPGKVKNSDEGAGIFNKLGILSTKQSDWQELLDKEKPAMISFISNLSPIIGGLSEIRQEELNRWYRWMGQKAIDFNLHLQFAEEKEKAEEEEKFTLAHLAIAGFKAYGKETTISFSPITILLGKNNSGKSALIQALLLLKQSLENQNDAIALKFHGPYWDLGCYENCCYQKKTNNPMQFKIAFNNKKQMRAFGFQFELSQDYRPILVRLKYYYYESVMQSGEDAAKEDFKKFSLFTFIQDSNQPKRLLLKEINSMHPFGKILTQDLSFTNQLLVGDERVALDLATFSPGVVLKKPDFYPDPDHINDPDFEYIYHGIFQGLEECAGDLNQFFRSIVYIGPNRPYIKRFYTGGDDKGMQDEKSLELFNDILVTPDIKRRVNDCLEEFEIGFEFDLQEPLKGTSLLMPILKSKANNLSLAFCDVGQGLTHLFPIIVNLIAKKNSFIIIEQPEIHIHPALQSLLGDLFIKSVKENKNSVLVESHSEYILDRLQRRIAEGEDITNNNVIFYYLENAPEAPNIENLEMNQYGLFKKKIPGEFFYPGTDDSKRQIESILKKQKKI